MTHKIKFLSILMAASLFTVSAHTPAYAICEIASVANNNLSDMLSDDYDRIEELVDNLTEFMEDDFDTHRDEVIQRIDEFETNILDGLEAWWDTDVPNAKAMFGYAVGQVNTVTSAQSADHGRFIDADTLKQSRLLNQKKRAEQHYRLRPSERSCQVASSAPEGAFTEMFTNAVARGLMMDGLSRNMNNDGGDTGDGQLFARDVRWTEYNDLYCDPDINRTAAGCAALGPVPNFDINYPGLMWDNVMTYDLAAGGPGNRINVSAIQDAVDQLVFFEAEPLIPRDSMDTTYGKKAMLAMRTRNLRRQVVHHALSQMLASRVSSSALAATSNVYDSQPAPPTRPLEVQEVRNSAGGTDYSSLNPGYREYRESMFKDRYRDVEQWAEIQAPSAVLRSRVDGKAVQLQLMNDLYSRVEDMMMLVAVDIATDLDNAGDPSDLIAGSRTVN